MKPGEPLYNQFSQQVEALTPQIYAYEETRSLTAALLTYAREAHTSVAIPRLGHYRTALQRAAGIEGVTVPNGRIYKTPTYEDYSVGEQPIEYENRLLLLTSDTDESKGRVANFLEKIADDHPKHKGTFALFGIVTLKDAPMITSVDAITFAVVQTNSGEAFFYAFRANPNKGKIRATEGMSDEWGEVRDRIGYFDTCPVEAVAMDNETMLQVRLELEKAKTAFLDTPDTKVDNSSKRVEKVQEIGKTILSRLGFPRKVSQS